MALNPKAVALTLGIFAAVAHLIFTIAIVVGGQSFLNWVAGIHMISGLTVAPFSAMNAVMGIVVPFILASIFGYILATIWNFVSEKV